MCPGLPPPNFHDCWDWPTFTIAGTGPGKKVIHAVGPDLRDVEAHDTAGALRTLSDAYMNVLREFALCGETRCPPSRPAPRARTPAKGPRVAAVRSRA